jgi:hypothetical protein
MVCDFSPLRARPAVAIEDRALAVGGGYDDFEMISARRGSVVVTVQHDVSSEVT